MTEQTKTLPQIKGQMFITDGGIETHMIFNEGHDLPHFSVFQLNGSAAGRQAMRDYYHPYIEIAHRAGQGFLFDTNTWRANPDWGALVGYDAAKLRAVNIEAIRFSREVAKDFHAAGVPTVVSGAIGPRRDAWQYDGAMSVDEAMHYHEAQIAAFAEAGADLVTAYTLTNTPEAIGIARLAEAAGLPCVLSFTLETDGRLPGGKALGDAIGEVEAATGGSPAYYMINCVHPIHFASTVRHAGAWVDRIGGLRVNASMKSHAELDESETLDIGDWQDLAQRYQRILPLLPNIRVIGGCCGTDHRHIGAIAHQCLPGYHDHAAPTRSFDHFLHEAVR
ncbi:homocysteine S-methyltransferase family protein [Devosia sp. XJ19-1]|uniref:Homocysteine S-methyltransferase family protein n=1 Tax=Devosia ureilytica TaxID=2952754 RepID=A0A9Q4AMG0_9HYPH|nr:homocysteine S-methyltransferase family protein [Devosia ureilytica]MCP8882804.1 homocysteine S-methyltransferase family protein [Devosia ureilytica]MCP8886828.1 homocysteine S-methyltransferase family protein [Devosia ureilytica]